MISEVPLWIVRAVGGGDCYGPFTDKGDALAFAWSMEDARPIGADFEVHPLWPSN